jgi:uncharacterized protein (TIGR02145 family)
MKTKFILFQLIVLLLLSCDPQERNNPFDPACPKQLFTPTNFLAVQEENTVKLTWSSPSANFTGFKITKCVDNGDIITLGQQPKDSSQLIDMNITGGQQHVYTIVAYAGNNESYSLNAQVTPLLPASVLTNSPSLVGTKNATFNGSINSNGGSQITERGFCWSLNINPTIADNKIINQSGLNNFNEVIIGLNANTNYYVRAYAINNQGISYGNQQSFATLGYGSVTDIDNNVYSTITVGSQVWMVENLKTTKYNYGASIPNITSSWGSIQNGAYCWYNNDISNKNIYGALYNFFAVRTNYLAPNGWHIPTKDEWLILINYLGGYYVAGGKMKEVGFTHWTYPNTNATDIVGFKGLPGGSLNNVMGVNNFIGLNTEGSWWSSSSYNSGYAYYTYLSYAHGQASSLWSNFPLSDDVRKGFSVRCVKD